MSSLIHDYSLYIALMYMTYIHICFLPTDLHAIPNQKSFPTFQYCLNTKLQSLFDPMFTRERELVKVLGVYSQCSSYTKLSKAFITQVCLLAYSSPLLVKQHIQLISFRHDNDYWRTNPVNLQSNYVLQSLINQFYLWYSLNHESKIYIFKLLTFLHIVA